MSLSCGGLGQTTDVHLVRTCQRSPCGNALTPPSDNTAAERTMRRAAIRVPLPQAVEEAEERRTQWGGCRRPRSLVRPASDQAAQAHAHPLGVDDSRARGQRGGDGRGARRSRRGTRSTRALAPAAALLLMDIRPAAFEGWRYAPVLARRGRQVARRVKGCRVSCSQRPAPWVDDQRMPTS